MKKSGFLLSMLVILSSSVIGFEINRICNTSGSAKVNIYWNKLTDTCNGFNRYKIHVRETQNGSFRVVDSISNPEIERFVQSPANLNNVANWYYYIEAELDCPSGANVKYSDTVKVDKESPAPVIIDSVSIENNNPVIGWEENSEEDIEGYIIDYVNQDNGRTQSLDTVYGKTNTLYIDSIQGTPSVSSEKYRISAMDSCGNISQINQNPHTSINLEVSQDSCNGTVNMTWNNYKGWDVDSITVFSRTNDSGSFEREKSVDGLATSTKIKDVQNQTDYEFFLRAYKNGDPKITSKSNTVNIRVSIVIRPNFLYLSNVSVVDSNVIVNWVIDRKSGIKEFIIYRGSQPSSMRAIDRIPYNGQTSFQYVDTTINSSDDRKFYRIVAEDLCGGRNDRSNLAANMLLRVKNDDQRKGLTWDPYVNWAGGLSHFEVQRNIAIADSGMWNTIDTVRNQPLAYSDYPESENVSDNGICYRIVAREESVNDFGIKASSNSNVVCVYNEAIVFIPNAMNPTGIVDKFKLKGRFIDYERSSMRIYNRWGQKVYKTDNISKGWDGTFQDSDEYVPFGTYEYVIILYGKNNEKNVHKGEVHVID